MHKIMMKVWIKGHEMTRMVSCSKTPKCSSILYKIFLRCTTRQLRRILLARKSLLSKKIKILNRSKKRCCSKHFNNNYLLRVLSELRNRRASRTPKNRFSQQKQQQLVILLVESKRHKVLLPRPLKIRIIVGP